MENNSFILSLQEAEVLAVAALCASRTREDNARSTARALVAAEADGQKGHGLSRVPSYAAQALAGKVDGFATPLLEQITPAAIRIDGGLGFAYPAIDLAVDALTDRAGDTGIALAAIRRSHHFGQAGAHAERLADRGLIAVMLGNSPKAIAFWGGREPMMGTNPIAFAAPVAGGPPLVIDLALSVAARGKIVAAKAAGESIPDDWALDPEGKPTTDPATALAGSLTPVGGAKGSALALMVEVMTAALTGSHFGFEASSMFDTQGGPPNIGQVIIAIDPGLVSAGVFERRMGDIVSAIDNTDGARLPGVSRLERRTRAAGEGLTIDGALHRELKRLADG